MTVRHIYYLLTVSCQQKKEYITKSDINVVLRSLPAMDYKAFAYETSGKYSQLHYHAVVEYKGSYKPFTSWGSIEHTLTYRIHWVRVWDLKKAIEYVYKDQPLTCDEYMFDLPGLE